MPAAFVSAFMHAHAPFEQNRKEIPSFLSLLSQEFGTSARMGGLCRAK
jgi:hypothetical protein